jgi:multidrug efflux system outer membrane protein
MLAAFTDVETALTAYAKEQTRRQSLARAAEANQRAVALARDLYQHGLAISCACWKRNARSTKARTP